MRRVGIVYGTGTVDGMSSQWQISRAACSPYSISFYFNQTASPHANHDLYSTGNGKAWTKEHTAGSKRKVAESRMHTTIILTLGTFEALDFATLSERVLREALTN